MGLVREIATRTGIKVHDDANLELIDLRDGTRFVDACESEGVMILGVEAFEDVGDSVVSRIEEIADFSMARDAHESFAAAREFLTSLENCKRMLEFVLDRQE